MIGQHENDGMVSFYSVGPDGWPRINDKVTQLLAWRPDGGV